MIALFFYVLTYGAAAASLLYPYVGLLVYVCFGIIRPEYFGYDVVAPGNYSRVAGLGLLAGWAIQGFGDWRLGRAGAVAACISGYWLWSIASAFTAPNQEVAWDFVVDMAKLVIPVVAGLTLIDSTAKLKQLAWVIVLSQSAVALTMEIAYFGGFNRMKEVGFSGYDNNGAALLMVTSLGVAFYLGLSERILWRRALALGGALMMAHCILISDSRGGMLAMLAAACTAFLLMPRWPNQLAAVTIALCAVAMLASPETRARFQTSFSGKSQRDESARERLALWGDNWNEMLKHPVFGCGPGHWKLVADQYGWPKGKSGHTMWLQNGAELGIPGLAMLVGFYALLIRRLWPLLRLEDGAIDPWLCDAARMVIAGLVAFAVSAQFVTVTAFELPYFVALLGAGVLKVASAQSVPQPVAATVESPSPALSRLEAIART